MVASKGQKAEMKLIDSNLLDKAVGALLKHHNHSKAENDKNLLLGSDEAIHVQFNLTRIPEQNSLSSRPIRIEIPHSLHKLNTKDDSDNEDEENDALEEVEVCFIVKDSSKEWIQTLISQFPKQLSYIKKVLTLTSLRKKYGQYQDKRTLCNSYTLFLVDDAILPMVGKLLGKTFFMKKKQPVPVKVSRKEALPFAVEKCIKSTFMTIGAGTCLSVKAGFTTMSSKTIEDNIQSVIQNVIPHVPRKSSNISSISIKTDSSVALPIYNKIREELDEIQKLAKVENTAASRLTNNNNDDTPKKKKRSLDDDESNDVNSDMVEEEKTNKKKQKKEAALKSPLLKALKKQKNQTPTKETSDAAGVEKKEIKTSKSSEKKKLKKRSNSKSKDEVEEEGTPKKKVSTKKEVKASAATPPTTPSSASKKKEKGDFIVSKTFKGSKKGYAFRTGDKGVGYYIDVKPVPNVMAMQALLRGGGSSSKNSGKSSSRRQSAGGKNGRRNKGRRTSY